MAISRLDTLIAMDSEVNDLWARKLAQEDAMKPLNTEIVMLKQKLEQQKILDEQAERNPDSRKETVYENKKSAKVEELEKEIKLKGDILLSEVNTLKSIREKYEDKRSKKEAYMKDPKNLDELLKEIQNIAPKSPPVQFTDEKQSEASKLYDLKQELKQIKANILESASQRSKELAASERIKERIHKDEPKPSKEEVAEMKNKTKQVRESFNEFNFLDTPKRK